MDTTILKNFNIDHGKIRDHSPYDLIVSDSGNISEIEVCGIKIPILSLHISHECQGEKPPFRFDDPIYYDAYF